MSDELLEREVRAIARDHLADVDDVALLGDLSRFADERGDCDAEAVAADLDALVARKPYLARPVPRRGPRPDMSQGSSGNGRHSRSTPADEFAGWLTGAMRLRGIV